MYSTVISTMSFDVHPQEVMPLPPEGDAATEALEGVSLEFSRVECLLFTFHQLAKHQPEFLTEDPDRLKDFRVRSVMEALCNSLSIYLTFHYY